MSVDHVVDDRYFGEIWERHFRTRNDKPLSRVLVRRIIELIYDRVTKERPLHHVLSTYEISQTEFMEAAAEGKHSNRTDGD